jgi:hypothetical protein
MTYHRKYQNPADRMLAQKRPKTEEHKRKLSEAHRRYWTTVRAAMASQDESAEETNQEEVIKDSQEQSDDRPSV